MTIKCNLHLHPIRRSRRKKERASSTLWCILGPATHDNTEASNSHQTLAAKINSRGFLLVSASWQVQSCTWRTISVWHFRETLCDSWTTERYIQLNSFEE